MPVIIATGLAFLIIAWLVFRRRTLADALRMIGLVGGLLMLAAAVWIMWLGIKELNAGRVDNGIKSIGAAAVLFLLSNVERFENFNAFGFSAKTRALTESLDKAVATIAQLKAVAAATSQGILSALAAAHDLGKANATDTLDLRAMNASAVLARDTLRGLQVDEEAIGKALKPWKDCILVSVIEYTICARLQFGPCADRRQVVHDRLVTDPAKRQALDQIDLFFRSDMPKREVPKNGYKYVLDQIDTTLNAAAGLDGELSDRMRDVLWPWRARIRRLYEENSLGDGDYWNVASRNLAEPIG